MRLKLIAVFAACLGAFAAPAFAQSGITGGRIAVSGPSASGAAAVGNPVGMGCTFTTAIPTLTSGWRNECQLNNRGQLRTILHAQNVAGTDGVNNGNLSTPNLESSAAAVTPAPLIMTPVVFNGTTFDRQRGDTVGTVVQPGLAATHWNYPAAAGGITNTTTAVTIKAAAGASIRNCIAGVQVVSGTLGAATEVAIRDGAAGAVLWRSYLSTAGGDRLATFPVPICGTANTLLEVVTLTATVTGGVYVNVQGFTR